MNDLTNVSMPEDGALSPDSQEFKYKQLVQAAWREASNLREACHPADLAAAHAPMIPNYQIIREIHRGGQGVVYEAIQESTRRTVAVKIMLEGSLASERARWRFEQEITLVATLKHPNIVPIHDSGIAHGRYFYAMDYVHGQPLDTHARMSGMPVKDCVRLFVCICDAVAYAHRREIIHRDLKPSNILVSEDGEPQVLDFGLAKIMAQQEQESHAQLMTVAGQVLGTVRYMSPEQTLGELESVDTRTDVYTLGVILYELLTGRPPYETAGDMMKAFRNIRETDPTRPSRVQRDTSPDLDAVILKAMHKEPDRRYSSAGELKEDLAAWLDGRPVTARSDSSFYVLRKLAVKHYFHSSVILALLAALVGFGGVSYHFLLQTQEAMERQRISDIGAEMANRDIEQFFKDGQRTLRQEAIGWLLLGWRDGDQEGVQEILSALKSGSPEQVALKYLVEEDVPAHELRRVLLPEAAALYHFVLAEQHLKSREPEQAKAEFSRCIDVPGDAYRWFRRSAAARLRQLEGSSTLITRPIDR